jgi:pimeloyl-ACP methyl ester carboxylesterase
VSITLVPTPAPTPEDEGADLSSSPHTGPRGHLGRVVAGSLTIGLVAALLLFAVPFIPARESGLIGAVLCGFALGWATLAVLSIRFTDQPQRWAVAPALFMGLSGLLLIGFGPSVREAFSWVWPPALLVLVIWMIVGVHRQLRSRSRWLLYPVIAMLAVASLGGGYETVSAATATQPPMPGQLIDVGGHRLHLDCIGSGGPTVVLQSGGGEMSSSMGWIAPRVAGITRVCAYDRAGHGWSDPAATAQDAVQIAIDLHTLLQRAHVPGPYVLAGHSFGGLYVLAYADRYPDEVAGMVVVDSTAPKAEPVGTTPSDPGSYDLLGRISTLLSSSAQLGLTRLEISQEGGSLPPKSRDAVRATATGDNFRATIDEYVKANTSMRQAGALGDFGDKPLVVLTAGDGGTPALLAAHAKLATTSTNSAHRVIDGADHHALISDEQHSRATTQAILDVVSSIRSGEPLVR